jgi:hypothetical protein
MYDEAFVSSVSMTTIRTYVPIIGSHSSQPDTNRKEAAERAGGRSCKC